MPDESAELDRDGVRSLEGDPIHLTRRARNERSSRVAGNATRDSSLWSRHASRAEILVALWIILFALIFICKARGDERSAVSSEASLRKIISLDVDRLCPSVRPLI